MRQSLFSSGRERRLWLWTLATMVAIYSTLGPARALVDALREHNLLRISMALALAALVGIIVWGLVKRRANRGEIGVALGVAFAYAWTLLRMASPEERTHLIEYGIVAALVHQAFVERVRHGRLLPAPAAFTVVVTAVLGLLDECIQALLPGRVFDVRDIFFNALAGFMAVVARLAMAPPAQPGWRVWFLWLLGSGFGWGVGMEAGSVVQPGGVSTLFSSPTVVMSGYIGVTMGATLATFLQWLVLRGQLVRSGWWILTGVGASAVFGIVVLGVGAVAGDTGWVMGTALFGTVVGVLQWVVMRLQLVRAGWWVLASTTGWVVGLQLGEIVGWLGLGAGYGAITGTSLVLLLRRGESRGLALQQANEADTGGSGG